MKKETPQEKATFKVVMPLAIGGESALYHTKFARLGADFVGELCKNDSELIALAKDADAIVTVGSIRPMPRQVIESLEKCRIIGNTQIGYDSIDVNAAIEKGILVTNVPDYCVEEVSDHTMALLLACARRIVQLNTAAKKGQWGLSADGIEIQTRIWPKLSRLQGQTLGLIGFGKVSRAILPKARGFQLRVLAYDPYVSQDAARKMGVELVDLEALFKESDFISVHSALTSETEKILNDDAFNKMKQSACVINAARGGLVDEAALYRALKEGKIAMAALDVTDLEPPGLQNPLLDLDNVIITAHSAFFSPKAEVERWHRPVEEIARVMIGQWPKSLVNPEVKKNYVERWGKMEEPK